MSRLLEYCESKLTEARDGKERATRYLGVIEHNIKLGEPVGPMQYIYTEKDVKKAKGFIEKWNDEIAAWEAEKALLFKGLNKGIAPDKLPRHCTCPTDNDVVWDAFGGGTCKKCGGHSW